MNDHTISWSLRLSRWKHLVVTSFSSASLQMGSDWLRQKARSHRSQREPEVARLSRRTSRTRACAAAAAASPEEEEEDWGDGEEVVGEGEGLLLGSSSGFGLEGGVSPLGRSSIMVLFVKQVHLQKLAAGGGLVVVLVSGW